ncbi:hypothetical protein F4810DRAFT_57004 [Camillea tinctor]|nr:hypothetical protein F4810DRAFT_57004 [Camillea tinctor]
MWINARATTDNISANCPYQSIDGEITDVMYYQHLDTDIVSQPSTFSTQFDNTKQQEIDELPWSLDDESLSTHSSLDQNHQISYDTQVFPTTEVSNGSSVARDALAELGLQKFLRTVWSGSHGNRRARSWPRFPDARRYSDLMPCDEQVETKQRSRRDCYHAVDGKSTMVNRIFACPFYRHDPRTHLACLRNAGIRDISSLIKHMWNFHRQAPYCPICGATFFTTELCDGHIRSRQCRPQDATWLMGVTQGQMQQIIDESQTQVFPVIQWFVIWSIIFPDEEPPSEPHLSGGLESIIGAVWNFWESSGQNIIANFIEENRLCTWGISVDRSIMTLHEEVFSKMIDRLLFSYTESKDTYTQECGWAAQIIATLWPSRKCMPQ